MENKVKYCEVAISSIFEVLKSDFLISYIISHTENKNLKNVIVSRIMKRTSKDLSILNKFII